MNLLVKNPCCLLLFILLLFSGCLSKADDTSVTVFAAASTIDLMNDLALAFERKEGVPVKINPASSGTLARQLKTGAYADIYISASKKWMDFVDSIGNVADRSSFMKNRLVLISHMDSELESFELSSESRLPSLFSGRLSIGDPAHVPAGKYAAESLKSLGWYDELEDRFLPAPDVRAALSVIEFDEAELGIVYATDAGRSDKVKVLSVFPEDSHPPILYFCARLDENNSHGKAFYGFLLNNSVAFKLYEEHGFKRIGK